MQNVVCWNFYPACRALNITLIRIRSYFAKHFWTYSWAGAQHFRIQDCMCTHRTQISLHSCTVFAWLPVWSQWSKASYGGQRSDQTARKIKLIWVFAGRTCNTEGKAVTRLTSKALIVKEWSASGESLTLDWSEQFMLTPQLNDAQSNIRALNPSRAE